jgi:competence protein ComEC
MAATTRAAYSVRIRNVLAAFQSAQSDRFVLFLPVFMASGILAYFSLTTEPAMTVPGALLAGCLVLCVWLRRKPVARAGPLCAAFALAGFLLACLAARQAPPWIRLPRHAVLVTGRLAQLDILPEGRRVTIDAAALDEMPAQPRALRIRLRASDTTKLRPGDLIRVRALVRPPAPPDYPGGRDTERDAFFDGIAGYGFALGPVELISQAPNSGLAPLRARIADRVMRALPGPAGAIAATLLTGSGTAIPAGDRLAFQNSGLAHLLAVAGLHVGIVMGLAFAAIRLALAGWERAALHWPTRQIAALAALAAGLFYLGLTGAHVPTLRSFAMACVVALGILTGRRAISLRSLAVAATLLMVASPEQVIGVSFQMSFAAVMVLITGASLARPWLARLGEGAWWRWPARHLAGLCLTSLLAGTASLPFAAYHFGRAGLLYVPANLLAVPLTAFWVMPWGLAALALMPFGLERLALAPMGAGIDGLIAIARAVAAWPGASLAVPQIPPWSLALIAAGLCWACLWRGRLRLLGAAPLLTGLAAAIVAPAPDILIAPQGRLIAARLGGTVMVEAAREATFFDQSAPSRLWGGLPVSPFTTEPGVMCTRGACRAALRGRTILLAREAASLDCRADVILSAAWLHDACPGAALFDRATILREGAITLRLTEAGVVARTDRGQRGARPWVIKSAATLPMAPTE